jgi:hypothetical protein
MIAPNGQIYVAQHQSMPAIGSVPLGGSNLVWSHPNLAALNNSMPSAGLDASSAKPITSDAERVRSHQLTVF